ncbi:hypothetical protein ACFFRR_000107 [Megaselia abdita]
MTDQVPEDERIAPEWMTKEFFENILRNSENDETIEVIELVVKPGSNLGDHYASVMFRGLITYNSSTKKGEETSLIIKTMPFVDGPKKELLGQSDIFEIEISMYNDVIPKFEKILKEANDDTQIGCKCLYSCLEPHKTMVFEDLTRKNFRCPGDFGDNMFDVAMKALSKLAKWHAISYKLNADGGKISKEFQDVAFKDMDFEEFPLFRDGLNFFIDMMKNEPDFKDYTSKFEKLKADNFLKKATRAYESFKKGEFANLFVLNHGDFHLKNTMMADNDGELEVLLIDFQICFWGPAVMDLTYFLYMSIDTETRATKRNEIIYTYYETFTATLTQIGFTGKVPKLSDLYKDFLSFKDYELLLIMCMMPMVCNVSELNGKSEDPSQFMDNDDYRKSLYSKKTYKEFVKNILPELLYKGYLD